MIKKVFILLFTMLALGCQEESFLRLAASEVIKDLEPAFASPQQYRSGGDTISLRLISQNTALENTTGFESVGSLGDFDKVERERRMLVIGSDTPFFRFEFNTLTSYNENTPTRSQDVMEVLMQEENGTKNPLLKFQFTDSLRCISASCAFADTLQLDSTAYFNVYFNGAASGQAVYINSSQGLAAFRTSDNKTYEKIK